MDNRLDRNKGWSADKMLNLIVDVMTREIPRKAISAQSDHQIWPTCNSFSLISIVLGPWKPAIKLWCHPENIDGNKKLNQVFWKFKIFSNHFRKSGFNRFNAFFYFLIWLDWIANESRIINTRTRKRQIMPSSARVEESEYLRAFNGYLFKPQTAKLHENNKWLSVLIISELLVNQLFLTWSHIIV